jgi:hypothetical protein
MTDIQVAPEIKEQSQAVTTPAPRWVVMTIALYLAAAAVLMFALMVAFATELADGTTISFGFGTWTLNSDTRLLMLAAVSGALGSFIHAATSFSDYVGNQRIVGSWLTWYIFRPLIGAALAVVLYFVMRAGLLSAANGSDVNVYGVTAVAALTGMFSKQATDKLDEVFKTMFRTTEKAGDSQRAHKLDRQVPSIVSVAPPSLPLGSGTQQLTVSGTSLTEDAFITVNEVRRPTRFEKGKLVATLLAEDVSQPAVLRIAVINPDGATSPAVNVSVS